MLMHGWGRYPVTDAQASAPASFARARHLVRAPAATPLIARGMGRSYGDSALAPHVLDTRRLDWLLAFDPESGTLTCAAGATLHAILEVLVPRGWFLPVTPGTRYVTVGGAIASDVHGKNHHHHGCFSEFVLAFDILLADGSIVTCSRSRYADLFHATCGGMGLTGVILRASLRLLAIDSAFIDQTTCKARNLSHALALFEAQRAATYSVAWIDCLASGNALGRALVTTGEHAAQGALPAPPARALAVPFATPGALLNPHTMRAFNALYFHRQRRFRQSRRVHYQPFFYPLDRIGNWNRLYGSRGFVQYQCVLPRPAGALALHALLARVAASGRGSLLAVLKEFGAANRNPLSFPMAGYTLALDFKMAPGVLELLDELDAIVLDHGGRLYLAKDARMSAATFRRCYPQWEAFQATRERYGALGAFASLQSRRLGL